MGDVRNTVHKIVSIAIAVACFCIATPFIFLAATMILAMLFSGFIAGVEDAAAKEFWSMIVFVLSAIISIAIGAAASLYVYFYRRERGYADTHVRISNRGY